MAMSLQKSNERRDEQVGHAASREGIDCCNCGLGGETWLDWTVVRSRQGLFGVYCRLVDTKGSTWPVGRLSVWCCVFKSLLTAV